MLTVAATKPPVKSQPHSMHLKLIDVRFSDCLANFAGHHMAPRPASSVHTHTMGCSRPHGQGEVNPHFAASRLCCTNVAFGQPLGKASRADEV